MGSAGRITGSRRSRAGGALGWVGVGGDVERDAPPFAYFCEVAGALDGIRGTNHGIPAVPGWWRYRMDRFADQVAGCCDAGCGIPLRRLGHLDTDQTYDYSAAFIPLVDGKIPRSALVGVSVSSLEAPATERPTDYQGLRSIKPGAST